MPNVSAKHWFFAPSSLLHWQWDFACIAYGPYSFLGRPLTAYGYLITNNATAFILSQLYGGLAYFVIAARTAFESVPKEVEEAADTLGASKWQIFWLVTLPVARRGVLTGIAIAWVHVIGEFGIAMTFAYFPQGIPVRLYVNLQNDGVDGAYVLVWLLLLATLPFPLWAISRSRADKEQLGTKS